VTDINPELRKLNLGDLEAVHWKSFDGKEIWGLLLTPFDYRRDQRIPMVVYCHGGPIGGYTYGLFPSLHIALDKSIRILLKPWPLRGWQSYSQCSRRLRVRRRRLSRHH